ncbi:MAG TPA: M48 family metalloprotease, partial [Candidatus Latescibacteria bacterium]|nr:M48 family metalloprotease [Candidatus Latescibacterota bacterium]
MAQALDNIRVDEKGEKMEKRTRGCTRAILALVALVTFGGCAVSVNPVTGKRGMYAYSWQQEISLGAETDVAIGQEYGLYEDAALTSYVRSVGESVLEKSHLRRPEAREEFRKTVFTFRVLDSPVVNAFAVPGGYVYVTRGLLAYAENEAQLAVVLGHEIGHVAARHSSRSAVKSVWSQLGITG